MIKKNEEILANYNISDSFEVEDSEGNVEIHTTKNVDKKKIYGGLSKPYSDSTAIAQNNVK